MDSDDPPVWAAVNRLGSSPLTVGLGRNVLRALTDARRRAGYVWLLACVPAVLLLKQVERIDV